MLVLIKRRVFDASVASVVVVHDMEEGRSGGREAQGARTAPDKAGRRAGVIGANLI